MGGTVRPGCPGDPYTLNTRSRTRTHERRRKRQNLAGRTELPVRSINPSPFALGATRLRTVWPLQVEGNTLTGHTRNDTQSESERSSCA
jgi:hypothetical protein